MLNWKEYRQIRKEQFGENRVDSKKNYRNYTMHHATRACEEFFQSIPGSFADTQPCHPCVGMTYAKEENPMRAYDIATAPTTHITLASAASADGSKTDLQTQREFLLSRWQEVSREYSYFGDITTKMKQAFNIDGHAKLNRPKTATEFLARIAAGTIKIDPKKQALQDIAIANGHGFHDDDYDDYIHADDMDFALDFGDPTPDRVGFETAKAAADAALKAAKDTIMIGTPEAGLAAIQALEAWTPTTAAN